MKLLKITFGFRNGTSIDFLCEKFECRHNATYGLAAYNAQGIIGKKPTWVEVEQIMYITTEEVEVKDSVENDC